MSHQRRPLTPACSHRADGCEPGKPFTKPSTWADILGREEARVMRLMLALRPDGHMFHQVRSKTQSVENNMLNMRRRG